MSFVDKFCSVYDMYVKREGSSRFLRWLESTDFFVAPASTRFHLCVPGGLVQHSVNVYERFRESCLSETLKGRFPERSEETIAICGLLHDVCKVNLFVESFRNVKGSDGVWTRVPYYSVDDKFPYGHGEKSVMLISHFMKLTTEESFAVRWHMGGFDDSAVRSFSVSRAFEQFPLAVLLHASDLEATYLDER
jgi:hypothetical protein